MKPIAHFQSAARCPRTQGFTMVELLVALVIGLLGSLAIMQIFTSSEGSRRATGSLADSQGNALVGLFSIERDLHQAGMGLTNLFILGCTIQATAGPVASLNNRLLVPAAIIPAGSAQASIDNVWGIPPGDVNSDILVVAYSTAPAMTEGTPLTRADSTSPFRLTNIMGIATNDTLLIGQTGLGCSMGAVTATTQATEEVTLANTSGIAYTTSAYAFNLGGNPRFVAYAVRNGALTLCDFMQADCTAAGSVNDPLVWQPIASDIVALVAQYGWDTSAPADGFADTFCKTRLSPTSITACPMPDQGSPGAGNAGLTQAVRACDWTRIPAIRIALVTRSGQYEKTEVSPASMPVWPDSTVAPTTTGPIYNIPDRHYRYRVVYSTVALRNMIWLGAQSCIS
jgi:type IV pilus assembly protein PilW